MESKEARLVWITLLAMKDSEGRVYASSQALAHRARVEDAACAAALEKFMGPDEESTTPDHEGRRLAAFPGGWQILNHERYRFSTEAKREFWKDQKRRQRELEAMRKGKPLRRRGKPQGGEVEYVKAVVRGDEAGADRILEASLPAAARAAAAAGVVAVGGSAAPGDNGEVRLGGDQEEDQG